MAQITLLKAIVGSKAYGTNIPQSDIDIKGIYLQDPLSVMSFDYVDQYYINKDEQYLELRRFLELLNYSNPTMLELLFTPENCILEKHDLFSQLLNHRQKFITKECKNSFLGYAKQQLRKADGLEKKINWEKRPH